MTNAPENRSRQPATRRTALAVGGLMASSALATGIFAWLTVRGRRSHDLKPGPTDPMLGHVGSQTVYACCLAGARAQVPGTPWAVDNADPGDGPWCLLVESGGETNLARGPSSRPPEDSHPWRAWPQAGCRPMFCSGWFQLEIFPKRRSDGPRLAFPDLKNRNGRLHSPSFRGLPGSRDNPATGRAEWW